MDIKPKSKLLITNNILFNLINELKVSVFIFEIFGPGVPGPVLFVNDYMVSRLGYDSHELIDHSPTKFILLKKSGDLSSIVRELLTTGKSYSNLYLKPKAESNISIELISHALPLKKSMLIVSIARELYAKSTKSSSQPINYEILEQLLKDKTHELNQTKEVVKVTENRLRLSEEKFRLITENMPQMVWTALPNGSVDYFSNQWLEYTGIKLEDSLGWGWTQTLHPKDTDRAINVWNKATQTGNSYNIQYRLKSLKTNQFRWFMARGQPQRDLDNNIIKWFGTCTDIDELVQTQNKLKTIAKNLEDSNRQLEINRKQLKLAKDEADRASNAKSEFLANISHELRTPLNSIIGYTQLLERNSNLNKAKANYLNIINRSGKHLLTLINDVLEMSKIEAGFSILNNKDINFYSMLNNIENLMKSRAEEKGIDLTFNCDSTVPMYIKVDDVKLRQVLINLIGNGIKFTKIGSVALNVTSKLNNDSVKSRKLCKLYFEILDTGIGIEKNMFDKIFNPFEQVDKPYRELKGTGLGLAISKKYVKLMGGKLRLSSNFGKGSKFSFSVNVELIKSTIESNGKDIQKVVGLKYDQPVYRNLIVDDNNDNRLLLYDLLQSVGFEVKEATNGKEAVNVFRNWHPHIIWMDIRMPIMDGYQAKKQIRSMTNEKQPIIIALTSHAFNREKRKILSSGFDDLISKPFSEEVIFKCIAKHIEVEYVYSNETDSDIDLNQQPNNSIIISHEELSTLPADMFYQLKKATIECDVEKINRIINDISLINLSLSMRLKALTKLYRFDMMFELLDEFKL